MSFKSEGKIMKNLGIGKYVLIGLIFFWLDLDVIVNT